MFDFISLLFNTVWSLFGMNFPGFDFSIGAVLVGALVVVLSFQLVGKVLGTSFDAPGFAKSVQQGGNNKKIKVSEERKGDEH